MSDNVTMKELMENYEGTEQIQRGDVVEGTVISLNDDEAILNIGYMADGVLPKTEVFEEEWEHLKVDDRVPCYIVKTDDGEGSVLLSLKKAQEIVVWDVLKDMENRGQALEVKVKEAVKGGVVARYQGARVFIPASQLSLSYVEDLTAYVGTKLEVKLIEVDGDKKRAVASHKEILKVQREQQRGDQLARLKEGDTLTGTVVRLANYGAFVNIGAVDGLVHVSQMSWRRVKHPSEVVKEGDVVEVIVVSVDRDAEKVGLKLAKVQDNPWTSIESHYEADQIVRGTVTRIANFGAFIELEEGIEGLCHISELSEQHVQSVQEVVSVGDEVEVYILSIDKEAQQMALSIKAVNEAPEEAFDLEELTSEEAPATLSDIFGDKLKNLKL